MHEYRFLSSAPGAAPEPPEPPPPLPEELTAPTARRSRQTLQGLALVLAGLIVGVLIVSVVTHRTAAQQPTALQQATVPPAPTTVDPPQTQVQPPAGTLPGDRIIGQITAVGTGSITLTRFDGSGPTTVTVPASALIIKNGVRSHLADLRPGDVAAVQLSGGTAQAIVVGGRGGRGDGGFGGPDDGDNGAGAGGGQPGAAAGGTST